MAAQPGKTDGRIATRGGRREGESLPPSLPPSFFDFSNFAPPSASEGRRGKGEMNEAETFFSDTRGSRHLPRSKQRKEEKLAMR